MVECPQCDLHFANRNSMGLHRRQSHEVPWNDTELLEEKYREKGMLIPEIADQWECSTTTIVKAVERQGLERKYEDVEWLVELYVEEGLKISEIAERAHCSVGAIKPRLREAGVKMRNPEDYNDTPWRDKDKFEELYVEKELTLAEIAEHFNSHISTITKWIDKHGFERRGNRTNCANYYTDKHGYEIWNTPATNGVDAIAVHRLAAVCHFGTEAVSGKVIHHKNGIEWDNRQENLEPMTRAEHMKHHGKYGKYNESEC